MQQETVRQSALPVVQTWLPVRIRLMEWMQLYTCRCNAVTGSWIKWKCSLWVSNTGNKRSAFETSNLYEDEILDQRFLLRKTENIDDLLKTGHCGAICGRWWALNNPLSAAYNVDSNAEWKPYLLDKEQVKWDAEDISFESYDQWMYVVVRKAIWASGNCSKVCGVRDFDQSRYANDSAAREVEWLFSINVDPTARPLNINVDYEGCTLPYDRTYSGSTG